MAPTLSVAVLWQRPRDQLGTSKAPATTSATVNTDIVLQNDGGSVALWDMRGTSIVGGGLVTNPGTAWSVVDNNMQFIYSTSANETLVATPATPDEFVFSSFAAGSSTIDRIQPGAGHDRVRQGAVRVLHRRAGSHLGDLRRGDDQPGRWQFVAAARGRCRIAARQQFCAGVTSRFSLQWYVWPSPSLMAGFETMARFSERYRRGYPPGEVRMPSGTYAPRLHVLLRLAMPALWRACRAVAISELLPPPTRGHRAVVE